MVASWLLDLTAQAFLRSPRLNDLAGRVSDSGAGRWTSIAAIDVGAPAPVLTNALYERFTSRGEADFADKVLRRCTSGSAATSRAKAEGSRPAGDRAHQIDGGRSAMEGGPVGCEDRQM